MKKYAIITPARDEEAHIEQTILSVVEQTIRPVQWIIVNDGSEDGTGAIIDRYAALYPWIQPLHRSNRGFRQAGGGVINAFYDGFAKLFAPDWEFIVKLDADLSFAPSYFESCFAEFATDDRLGIAGVKLEPNPLFHVRGATKIYRRECWDQIGGLLRAPGWDTVDEVKANMLGWSTRTLPHLQLFHYRFTGAADGAWKDCIKNGRANYITGYHPLFMLLKCIKRVFSKPYVIGSVGLFWGFLKAYLDRASQVADQRVIEYTRNQQMRRLLLLKTIWK
jgi:glycosyltransferase involved in cell wall biosynthesis